MGKFNFQLQQSELDSLVAQAQELFKNCQLEYEITLDELNEQEDLNCNILSGYVTACFDPELCNQDEEKFFLYCSLVDGLSAMEAISDRWHREFDKVQCYH